MKKKNVLFLKQYWELIIFCFNPFMTTSPLYFSKTNCVHVQNCNNSMYGNVYQKVSRDKND